MAAPRRRYTGDVPDDVEARLRKLCLALPDAYEEPAWVGTRWMVRMRTFAHVLGIEDPTISTQVLLAFRADGDDLEVLRHAGPPFVPLGWGRNALGLVLDDETDWEEVSELVTDSFCVTAPHKLVERVGRPDVPDDAEEADR